MSEQSNTERPVCPTCGAPVTIEPKRWTGTAAMHLDPPEAYDAARRFDPEAVIRQEVRDRAQRAGIDAYYNYLETLAGEDQDKPWAVTNALLHCINASLREAYAP